MFNSQYDWEREAHNAQAAAEQGQWNVVQQYYDRRHAWLQSTELMPELSERLVIIDREIERRILVAQAVLTATLADTSTARRRLSQVKASLGAGSVSYQLIDRSA